MPTLPNRSLKLTPAPKWVATILIAAALLMGLSTSLMAKADYPAAKFAIMSDLHYCDPSLIVPGPPFTKYLNNDRKLLVESKELLTAAVDQMLKSDAQFVLVTGDLTKDGEAIDHRLVAAALHRLAAAGKKVYVVPGNHDIANPSSVRYLGEKTEPTPSVTPSEFAEIYAADGYADAVLRDRTTLSYVAEPVPGLWLLALDACRYRENKAGGEPIVGGKLTVSTRDWIADVLKTARVKNKAVICMMHHGVLEHFAGQKAKFPDYVVADNDAIAELLAKGGVRIVFTGHFHALDITTANVADGPFHDVETGSLVTYPDPWRMVELVHNMAKVSTNYVTSIPSKPDLAPYSKEFSLDGLRQVATVSLRKYRVSDKAIAVLAPQIAERFLRHYQGDEPLNPPAISTKGVNLWGRIINWLNSKTLRGVSHDLAPDDLNVFLAI